MFNQQVQKLLTVLYEKYPLTFFIHHKRRRPLKVGIGHDLTAALGDRKLISAALRKYVSNKGYLKAIVEGAPRIDLDGEPVGVVSEADAKNARARIAGFKRHKPKPIIAPKRDGLSALREAARRRQGAASTGGGA
jgi:ProP effector